jgi:hypothetical protein
MSPGPVVPPVRGNRGNCVASADFGKSPSRALFAVTACHTVVFVELIIKHNSHYRTLGEVLAIRGEQMLDCLGCWATSDNDSYV